MKTVEYKRMADYERTYWWHLGRLEIIRSYLGLATKHHTKKNLRILNIGCGTGGTIDTLEQFGRVTNVDVSDEAIKFMKKSGYKNIKKVSGIKLPFPDNSFDVVGAFDVLEHIKQHEEALNEWRRVLKPGGSVVLTVPAYQWLWSGHDASLHHYRRYTKGLIRETAAKAKLSGDRVSYAIVFSLPLVVSFRFANRVMKKSVSSETSYVPVPPVVNSLFTRLLNIEAKAHKSITFPFGTSVVAILRKG